VRLRKKEGQEVVAKLLLPLVQSRTLLASGCFLHEGYPNRFRASIEKVKVSMGVSEFLFVALIGLAFFGGAIKVKFNGVARHQKKPQLKGGERKLLNQ